MTDSNKLLNKNQIPKNESISAENPKNDENTTNNKNKLDDVNTVPDKKYNPFKMTDQEIYAVVEQNLDLPNFVKKKKKNLQNEVKNELKNEKNEINKIPKENIKIEEKKDEQKNIMSSMGIDNLKHIEKLLQDILSKNKNIENLEAELKQIKENQPNKSQFNQLNENILKLLNKSENSGNNNISDKKLIELQNKIDHLSNQNNNLQNLIISQKTEIENMKLNFANITDKLIIMNKNLVDKCQQLSKKCENISKDYTTLNAEHSNFRKLLNNQNVVISNYKKEILDLKNKSAKLNNNSNRQFNFIYEKIPNTKIMHNENIISNYSTRLKSGLNSHKFIQNKPEGAYCFRCNGQIVGRKTFNNTQFLNKMYYSNDSKFGGDNNYKRDLGNVNAVSNKVIAKTYFK